MDLVSAIENSRENLFITGKAGTGKSTLLRQLIRNTQRNAVVCGPTGVAAINAGGQTIHSLFRIPPRMLNQDDVKQISFKQSQVVKKMDILVVDEIGMVRADMLHNLDKIMRFARGKPCLPFGGCQVVGFGDLYQLPPIITQQEREHFEREFESPYFFSAECVKEKPFQIIELMTVFRQTDEEFVEILNRIRSGESDDSDIARINSNVGKPLPGESIVICPYNQQVREINENMISKLPGQRTRFDARISGNFPSSAFPNDETVFLKPGAQVMILKNERRDDDKFLYVNGTIGVVESLGEDFAHVIIEGKKRHKIEFSEWDSIKYEYSGGRLQHSVVGTFSQIPLKAAAAFSIHKAQGKTFDKVRIDIGRGAFDFGQTYVGLSRCRSLDGLSLASPIKDSDVMVDDRIGEYLGISENSGKTIKISQEFDKRLC